MGPWQNNNFDSYLLIEFMLLYDLYYDRIYIIKYCVISLIDSVITYYNLIMFQLVIGTFGLLGNIFSIIIFSSNEMKTPFNTLLVALAIFDSIFISFMVFDYAFIRGNKPKVNQRIPVLLPPDKGNSLNVSELSQSFDFYEQLLKNIFD